MHVGQAPRKKLAERRRRLRDLATAAVLAAATVAILIAISQSTVSDPPAPGALTDVRNEVTTRFAGIPQTADTLGDPEAPLTLVEFADMQCPFCAQYDREVLPTLVERYVRPGTLKLVFRPLRFLGPDSETAAAAAGAAANQNRLWQFVDAFYRRQGTENSGYVTPAFLADLAAAVPGLDANALGVGDEALARTAETEAETFGIDSTPSFLLGRTGKPLRRLELGSLDPAEFTAAIDALAGEPR